MGALFYLYLIVLIPVSKMTTHYSNAIFEIRIHKLKDLCVPEHLYPKIKSKFVQLPKKNVTLKT